MTCTKLHMLDHFDGLWSKEDVETLVTRQGVVCLHQRLVSNKEALPIPHTLLEFRGPNLPEYERGLTNVSLEEEDEFLNQILYSQLLLARSACADSPFYCTLRRRLEVLQRIFCALCKKFHNSSTVKPTFSKNTMRATSASSTQGRTTVKEKDGASVLIEMGVRTGLSLLFALFHQSWQFSNGQLCNDVLMTACDVLSSIPPLSLAKKSKIPPMGEDCLMQITAFLKGVMSPKSSADAIGRQLACELLLRLHTQRGCLKFLLEWIEIALTVSHSQEKSEKHAGIGISSNCLNEVLAEIRNFTVSMLSY